MQSATLGTSAGLSCTYLYGVDCLSTPVGPLWSLGICLAAALSFPTPHSHTTNDQGSQVPGIHNPGLPSSRPHFHFLAPGHHRRLIFHTLLLHHSDFGSTFQCYESTSLRLLIVDPLCTSKLHFEYLLYNKATRNKHLPRASLALSLSALPRLRTTDSEQQQTQRTGQLLLTPHQPTCLLSIGITSSASAATSRPMAPTALKPAVWVTTRRRPLLPCHHHQALQRAHPQ